MTSAALEKTLLRCTKCGSNNLIHFPKPNINDELVCGACGERAITKEVAISNALSDGDLRGAAQLASTTFGDIGRKGLQAGLLLQPEAAALRHIQPCQRSHCHLIVTAGCRLSQRGHVGFHRLSARGERIVHTRLVALCPRTGSGNANEMWHQQKKVPTLRVQPLGRYGVRQTGRQEQKGPPSNRRQLLSNIRAQNKALLAGLRFG